MKKYIVRKRYGKSGVSAYPQMKAEFGSYSNIGVSNINQYDPTTQEYLNKKDYGELSTSEYGTKAGTEAVKYGALGAQYGGVIGGIVGVAGGAIGGALSAQSTDNKAAKQRRAADITKRNIKDMQSQAILDNYPEHGVAEPIYYYKCGGMKKYGTGGMEANGGDITPLASNINIAKGATHEQGGIQIGDTEVEHDEVSMDTKDYRVWFSDTLKAASGKTFADEAEKIGRIKGKAEAKLSKYDRFASGTGKRTVEKSEMALNMLAQEQLDYQLKKGINPLGTKAEYGNIDLINGEPINTMPILGLDNVSSINSTVFDRQLNVPTPPENPGQYEHPTQAQIDKAKKDAAVKGLVNGIGGGLASTVPIWDNVVNAVLTDKTPEIPKPTMYRALPRDTEFSIRGNVAEARRTFANTRQALERSSMDSSAVRNNIIAAHTQTINTMNPIYTQKQNIETSLKNQDIANRERVANANIDLSNRYDLMSMQRTDDIHNRISQNVSNLVGDLLLAKRENNQRRMDTATMYIMQQRYKESGVYNRNIGDVFQKYIKGEVSDEELFSTLNTETDKEVEKKKDTQNTKKDK